MATTDGDNGDCADTESAYRPLKTPPIAACTADVLELLSSTREELVMRVASRLRQGELLPLRMLAEGHSYREIRFVVGHSARTVRSIVHRVRKRFRAQKIGPSERTSERAARIYAQRTPSRWEAYQRIP